MEITNVLRDAIEAYKGGDKEAFTTIYNESWEHIQTCVCDVVSDYGAGEDMLDEIMQETYLELGKEMGSLKNVEDFFDWATAIARRKSRDVIKKTGRYVILPSENEPVRVYTGTNEPIIDAKESEQSGDNEQPEENVQENRSKSKLVAMFAVAALVALLMGSFVWKAVASNKPSKDKGETTSTTSGQQHATSTTSGQQHATSTTSGQQHATSTTSGQQQSTSADNGQQQTTPPETNVEKAPTIEMIDAELFKDDEEDYEYEVVRYEYDELSRVKGVVVEVGIDVAGKKLKERICYKDTTAFKNNQYYSREKYNEYEDLEVKVTADDSGKVSEVIENSYIYDNKYQYLSSKTVTRTTTTYDENGKKVEKTEIKEQCDYDNLYNVIKRTISTEDENQTSFEEYEYEYDDECNLIMVKGINDEWVGTYDMDRHLISEAYRNLDYSGLILYEYEGYANGEITKRTEYRRKGWEKDYDKVSAYVKEDIVSDYRYSYVLDENQRVDYCYKSNLYREYKFKIEYQNTWVDESTGEYLLCIDRPMYEDVFYKIIKYEYDKDSITGVYVEMYDWKDKKMAEEYYVDDYWYRKGVCEEWTEYSYQYNADGNVKKVEKVIHTRGSSDLIDTEFFEVSEATETNTYNELGQLVKVVKTDGRNTETYVNTYDESGDLVLTQCETKIFDMDLEEYNYFNHEIKYTYDEQGRLYQEIHSGNMVYTYAYDSEGRLISKTTSEIEGEVFRQYIYKYID